MITEGIKEEAGGLLRLDIAREKYGQVDGSVALGEEVTRKDCGERSREGNQ